MAELNPFRVCYTWIRNVGMHVQGEPGMDRERQATTECNQRRSPRGSSWCFPMIDRKAFEPRVSRTSASDSPENLRGAHGKQATIAPETVGEATGALAPSMISHAREPLLRRCLRLVLYTRSCSDPSRSLVQRTARTAVAQRLLNGLRATCRLGGRSGDRRQSQYEQQKQLHLVLPFSRIRSQRTGAWDHACIPVARIHYRAPVARKLWMPLLPTIA